MSEVVVLEVRLTVRPMTRDEEAEQMSPDLGDEWEPAEVDEDGLAEAVGFILSQPDTQAEMLAGSGMMVVIEGAEATTVPPLRPTAVSL